MDNIIKLEDRAALIPNFCANVAHEHAAAQFDEGMEVLAAYRALPDEHVRESVKQLIKSLANPPQRPSPKARA